LTLLILLPVCAALPALAGDDVWTAWGPPGSGGGAVALAVDPSTAGRLYAAAPPDVLISADGGQSWSWSGFGLGGARIEALAVEPRSSAVYADSGDALYRSDDGARHWAKVYTKHARASLLATAAASPSTLFTADGLDLRASRDGGATWTTLYTSGAGALRSLVVDPTAPRRLYLVAQNGLVQSADGGATWAPTGPVVSGAPFTGFNQVKSLTLSAAEPATLYAAAGEAFYRSADAGAHWTRVNDLTGDRLTAESAAPGRLYLAAPVGVASTLFFSADGGTTWHLVQRLTDASRFVNVGVRALASDPGSATVFTATSIQGVVPLRAGASTQPDGAPANLPTDAVSFLRFDPANPASVYAGTVAPDDQLFHSTDGGRTWARLALGLSNQDETEMDLEFAPGRTQGVYLALLGVDFVEDEGRIMTSTGLSLDSYPPRLLRRGDALLASGCGIFRRTDDAPDWSAVLRCSDGFFGPKRVVRRMIGTAANPALAYALVEESFPDTPDVLQTLYKSGDGGATWKRLTTAFDFFALAIDPTHPSVVYAGTADRVLKSTNGGRGWTEISHLAVNDLLVDTTTPSTLYAATETRGALRSTDGGRTWQPVNKGLAIRSRLSIASLTADPVVPHQIYANPWHGFHGQRSSLGSPGLFVIRFTDSP
jgi:photosystem II stability/assembly factor-like uncharacterized protein